MMKVFWHLVLVIPFLAQAQGGDSVFIVKAPDGMVKLSPETDELYKNINSRFKLICAAGVQLDSVYFNGGSAVLRDSQLVLKATKLQTALLKLYKKLPDGKSRLVLVKQFSVKTFREPAPNLDGVSNDSAIYSMKAVAQGFVNVPISTEEALKRISYPVVSFRMESVQNGVMDTLSATGNKLTYAMKDKVDHLPDGSTLNITAIRYVVRGDTLTLSRTLRVYIINDKIQKF